MVEPHHKFIRSDQVAYKVNNKKSIYNACSRNGYLMPPFNDPITTFEFCDMVRLRTIWLPKAEDCKGYTCVDKPTKFELAQFNSTALHKSANDADQNIPRW